MYRTNASPILRRRVWEAGFTLIEMMVVVAIIVLITALALARNSQFNSTILLSDAAYAVSFTIREAQVYGLSVKEFSGGSSATFSVGYGTYFDAGTPLAYTLFVDTDRDNAYQNPPDAVEEAITLKNGYSITELCGTKLGVEACDLPNLTITFERPDPDAHILSSGIAYDSARIVIGAGSGDTRSIRVYATGQISVAGQ